MAQAAEEVACFVSLGEVKDGEVVASAFVSISKTAGYGYGLAGTRGCEVLDLATGVDGRAIGPGVMHEAGAASGQPTWVEEGVVAPPEPAFVALLFASVGGGFPC